MSMAECEYGNVLQMKEHVLWANKLYKAQKETMTDILSTTSKTRMLEVCYRALKAEDKRRLVQGAYINIIPIFIYKKKKKN